METAKIRKQSLIKELIDKISSIDHCPFCDEHYNSKEGRPAILMRCKKHKYCKICADKWQRRYYNVSHKQGIAPCPYCRGRGMYRSGTIDESIERIAADLQETIKQLKVPTPGPSKKTMKRRQQKQRAKEKKRLENDAGHTRAQDITTKQRQSTLAKACSRVNQRYN